MLWLALGGASLVLHSPALGQDMRQRMNNRAAIVSGTAQGATSATPVQPGFNQPVVVARYAPFNGKWSASIVVLRPAGAGLTSVTQSLFRPGDGVRWSGGTGALRYFGGVNPFAAFLDSSADNALYGATDSRGIAFHGIHLPELFVVVGQVMRSVNTSAGLVAVQSVAGDDSAVARGGKRRSGHELGGRAETASQSLMISNSGQSALTWYVAVPEVVSLSESVTAQFAVMGCLPAADPENGCVSRAGVAFVPFTGTLATTSSSLAAATRYTVAPTSGTGAEFGGMLSRLGYPAAAAVQSGVQGSGVAGAVVAAGVPSGLFSEVATGTTESRIYADLTASTRLPATSGYATAASFLIAPLSGVAGVAPTSLAYLASLRTACDGCASTGSLLSGTTTAMGRVRDDTGATALGSSGINRIDGIAPVRKVVQ